MSTSWHSIQLLSQTRIGNTLPVTSTSSPGPVYWVAGTKSANATSTKRAAGANPGHPHYPRQATESYILKAAVYNATSEIDMSVSFPGVSAGATATLTMLTAPDGYSYNAVGSDVVKKSVSSVTASGNGTFSFQVGDLSVLVLETD